MRGIFFAAMIFVPPPAQNADSALVAALRAEIATLKKHQKIERGVCAVVSGFGLWRFFR